MRALVCTDLDGTLLDHHSYSWAPAAEAIEALRAAGIPLVLVSSKTRAEIAALRQALGNQDPFIVENGAADYWEGGVQTFGAPRAAAVEALAAAAAATGCVVHGFSTMTLAEIEARTELPPGVAALAADREFGEPFVLDSGDPAALAAALGEHGFALTQGGRFYHVLSGANKAAAVRWLLTERQITDSLALGDAPNDIEMLAATTAAWIVRGRHTARMQAALPEIPVTSAEGPAGWNAAVLAWLAARPLG